MITIESVKFNILISRKINKSIDCKEGDGKKHNYIGIALFKK